MRSHVNVFGTFQGIVVLVARVEVIIKISRERGTDTGDCLEVGGASAQDALQTSKVPQQSAPLGRAKSRNRLQDRLIVTTRAAAAMATDREAMRFVAGALDDPRGGRARLEHQRHPVA